MNGRADVLDVVEYQNYNCKNLNCFKCRYCWATSQQIIEPDGKKRKYIFTTLYSEGESIDTSYDGGTSNENDYRS